MSTHNESDSATATNNTSTYYEANKEKVKQRYVDNVDRLKAYQIEYNNINHEKYIDYQRNYYEEKIEEILRAKKVKVVCECGKEVSLGHLSCHKKTNIHVKKMAAIEALLSQN